MRHDAALLVDVDLSILGAQPAQFAKYERQIRQEYQHVDAQRFNRKRAEVLSGFLAQSRIFHVGQMHAKFEQRARANIAASLTQLQSLSSGSDQT